jgi:hypothetical protein
LGGSILPSRSDIFVRLIRISDYLRRLARELVIECVDLGGDSENMAINTSYLRIGLCATFWLVGFSASFFPLFFIKIYPYSQAQFWPETNCTVKSGRVSADCGFFSFTYSCGVRFASFHDFRSCVVLRGGFFLKFFDDSLLANRFESALLHLDPCLRSPTL